MKKGSKHSEEVKEKNRIAHLGKKPVFHAVLFGKDNAAWKGNNVSYSGLHKWINKYLGRASKCVNDITHVSTRYHWANISKEYKRDFNDFKQLCPSCNLKDRIGRRVSP